MRILVTGSRTWNDDEAVTQAITRQVVAYAEAHPELGGGPTDWVTVVHGDCPIGADAIADEFCTRVTYWNVERYPADWRKHGRRAGFVRNAEMVNLGADVCLAFIKDRSKGATMTADLAEKAGIKTIRYTA